MADAFAKPDQIYAALAAVMAEVKSVGKSGRNTQQNYSFRGIDGVLNAVGPAFRTHSVLPVPSLDELTMTNIEVGKNRSLMTHAVVKVQYDFYAPDGSSVTALVPGEAFDSGDKAISKAMSVAYRTALIQVLALPTNEPDPDETSYERAPAPEPIPAASIDQRDTISKRIAILTERDQETADDVRAWWKSRRFPPPERLNVEQADLVIAHLDFVFENEESEDGGALFESGAGSTT